MTSRRRSPVRMFASAGLAIAVAVAAPAGRAQAGCPLEPQPVCGDFEQARFTIDSYGHVLWRASGGPSAELDDFGDPDTTSHYFLCAWDENGLLVAADIPPGTECPGGSCWCSLDGGLRYDDPSGSNGDLRRLELSSTDEDGTRVRAQTLVIGGINLPVNGDLLVQLTRSDSPICFESLILADEFLANDRTAARAVSTRDDGQAGSDDR